MTSETPRFDSTAHAFVMRSQHMLTLRDAGWGTWYLPGGIVEEDEAPVAAAIRETFEETGLFVDSPVLLRDWDFPDVRRPDVRRRFLFVAESASVTSGSAKSTLTSRGCRSTNMSDGIAARPSSRRCPPTRRFSPMRGTSVGC